MFRPQNWLDRVFEIGIIGKGLNAALEIVGGLLLLFLTPARIHHVLAALTQGELSEDPGDFIATRLLHTANGLTGSAVLFGVAYLLIHYLPWPARPSSAAPGPVLARILLTERTGRAIRSSAKTSILSAGRRIVGLVRGFVTYAAVVAAVSRCRSPSSDSSQSVDCSIPSADHLQPPLSPNPGSNDADFRNPRLTCQTPG
jgi:hypothetical protein